MLRNYFLINMVLVIMLSVLGFKLYKVVTYSMDIPSEAAVHEGHNSKDIDIKFKETVPDKASFQIISSKDLFKPSRTASSVVVVKKALTAGIKYPKLFATIVLGSDSVAIIEDPDTKKSKGYHLNELVAGFVVSEILQDRVILLAGEEKVEIKLRDDKGIKASKPYAPRDTLKRTVPARRPVPTRRRPINSSHSK